MASSTGEAPPRAIGLIERELRRRDWTCNELARRLGITSGAMSRILTGKRKASRTVATAIERVLGVKVQTWEQAA